MGAPEIDPSSALAGLTLLSGGLAVMRGRRSRKLDA
jgi:LPXTG-motif cell wall-anchored protein